LDFLHKSIVAALLYSIGNNDNAVKVKLCYICLLLCVCVYGQGTSDSLRLNQIQIIASHNSYKKKPDEKLLRFLVKIKDKLGAENNPVAIDYGHLPFDSQFAYYNVRGLEIDINNDPKGGLYYKRKLNAFVRGIKQRSKIDALKQPGMKVLHIKDVDYETNYYTFKESLLALKQWSDAHPSHLPMFINIEAKSGSPAHESALLRFLGFKRSKDFDSAACDAIDEEIKSVFGSDLKNVLTPDIVRGSFNTLHEMASNHAWPLLDACRGKVIFIMEGSAVGDYLLNHPSLANRAMFVYSEPGKPEAAFIKRNNAVQDKLQIQNLVQRGYIVRTRADEGTWQARNNDYTDFNSAKESGAQIISTDYYKADLRFSTFQVQFENKEAGRANPIISNSRSLKE
jgi:hypothetical protein